MVQIKDLPYYTVRVKFKKVGSLQYISHLDLVRTMSKIVVRAGLPLWYTEGFNPKPKMIFAAPLSIGTESLTEFMDIRLLAPLPPDEVKRRLNDNMTEEMRVLEAYAPDSKMTDMKWLSYRISIFTANADASLALKCKSVLSSDSVIITKTGKSGVPTEVNIRPLIHSADVTVDDGFLNIDCVLSADSSSFLNPEHIVKVLKLNTGILSDPDITKEYYSIVRMSAFRLDMTPFR